MDQEKENLGHIWTRRHEGPSMKERQINNPKKNKLMTKAGLYEETLDGRRGNK